MKIDIKHRNSDGIIFSHEQANNSMKIAVEKAIELKISLSYANLRAANLSHADLRFANLSHADLSHANFSYSNLRAANLRFANLSSADLSSADLSHANFSHANFSHANLRFANLSDANLRFAVYGTASISTNPLQILGLHWDIIIFDYHIKIGCKLFLTVKWEAFDDEKIDSFHPNALEFWKANKAFILTAAKKHQKYNEEI